VGCLRGVRINSLPPAGAYDSTVTSGDTEATRRAAIPTPKLSDFADLVGMAEADAASRVRDAGYIVRVVPKGGFVTANLVPHRVDIVIDEGRVIQVFLG
jgi:hypothetical protein